MPITEKRATRVEEFIDINKRLKGARSNFETYWQSLHDYFYIEAQDVNTQYAAGNELTITNLYDSTSLEAADVLASGFMNYLTPPTSKWFSIKARDYDFRGNKPIAKWMEDVADQVNYTLNRANFYEQMYANFKSSGVYGTSAMLEEEDEKDDVRFFSIPIKQVCLLEDSTGRVTRYFIEFEYTPEQARDKWGDEALSDRMKQQIAENKGSDTKYTYLLVIGERYVRDVRKMDKKNMPIEALWIDIAEKKLVDESGYNEFPAMCHRFDKRPFIPWGFSPAMKALPFTRVLNAIAKTNLRAMMKITDPPVAVPDNAFIMPFNANPRAVNYYNKERMDANDIFSFANKGNPEVGMLSLEYYSNRVKSVMYNDVFLAFDNITKQMNNPEIMERINEKMTMLGPAVGRYISEMINPVIVRTIGVLWNKGKLPDPPEEFLMNPQYEIDCISQLAQSQRRSELNALVSGLSMVGQVSQFIPDVLDKIDADKVVDEAWAITGSPARVLRDDAEVDALRKARAQIAEQNAQMAMLQQGADVVEKGSKVDMNLAKAQNGSKNQK